METDEPPAQHLGGGAGAMHAEQQAAQGGSPASMQSHVPVDGQPEAPAQPAADGMESELQNEGSDEPIDAKQAFEILGIPTTSTPAQITKKYRKRALSLIAA